MSNHLKLITGAIGAIVVATAAHANTVAFNTSLAAGYYNGSGNPNVGFTTDTADNGIQLGLGVNLRFIGPVLPTSTNNYYVPLGAPAGAATWDFEYSVDFAKSGFSESNTIASLKVQNVANGQAIEFDPSLSVFGNATNGDGYQNAENLGFGFISFLNPDFDFNPNAVDQYIVTLSLADSNNSPLASVTESINATPIPASLPLFACGLGGLGLLVLSRKKRKSAAIAAC